MLSQTISFMPDKQNFLQLLLIDNGPMVGPVLHLFPYLKPLKFLLKLYQLSDIKDLSLLKKTQENVELSLNSAIIN